MTDFKNILNIYHNGDPLSDYDVSILLQHFQMLAELASENPDLKSIRPYTYMNLSRLQDITDARKEKR